MNFARIVTIHLWKPAAFLLALLCIIQAAMLLYAIHQPHPDFCVHSDALPCRMPVVPLVILAPPLATLFLTFALGLRMPRTSLIRQYLYAFFSICFAPFLLLSTIWATDKSLDIGFPPRFGSPTYTWQKCLSIILPLVFTFLVAFIAESPFSASDPSSRFVRVKQGVMRASLTTILAFAIILHLFFSIVIFFFYGVGFLGN